MERLIYADNAATTRLSPEVLECMMPYLTEQYGNPSSLYAFGSEAHAAVDRARGQVAAALGADAGEIYFTSGGSEADNWAIKGVMNRLRQKGKTHIISSAFEHHAVLHTLEFLEKQGFEVTLLDVHSDGLVRPEELAAAIKEETGLVTIMYANNEIGTIQPMEELGRICHERGVLLPHRRGAGGRQCAYRCQGAEYRHALPLRPQIPRAEGDWRFVYAQGNPGRQPHSRRRTGARPPRRNREHARYCRIGRGDYPRRRHHRRACRKAYRHPRPCDRPVGCRFRAAGSMAIPKSVCQATSASALKGWRGNPFC